MKKILVGVMGLVMVGCVSLPTATNKQMQSIMQVVEVNGKSKDQLFDESKIWIAKNFRSANNVIQYQDKAEGKILGRGFIPFPCDGFIDCGTFGKDRVNFTIQIDTKDNKSRISISDISATSLTHVPGGVNNIGRERPIQILEHQQRIEKKLERIANKYQLDISQPKADNNW